MDLRTGTSSHDDLSLKYQLITNSILKSVANNDWLGSPVMKRSNTWFRPIICPRKCVHFTLLVRQSIELQFTSLIANNSRSKPSNGLTKSMSQKKIYSNQNQLPNLLTLPFSGFQIDTSRNDRLHRTLHPTL